MANGTSHGYLVIRLIPASSVDSAAFVTYLDDLRLQAFEANPSGVSGQPKALTDVAYFSPLTVLRIPFSGDPFELVVSRPTTKATSRSGNNYGNTLEFEQTDGIPVGSYLFSPSDPGNSRIFVPATSSQGLVVTDVRSGAITLNDSLAKFVPAGTVASFSTQCPPLDPTSASDSISLTLATTQPPLSSMVLAFGATGGVAVGMAVSDKTGFIQGDTIVASVDAGSVTLSQPMNGTPPVGTLITFTLNPPFLSFSVKTTKQSDSGSKLLTFGNTSGIAFGMTVSQISKTGVFAPGTTVSEVQFNADADRCNALSGTQG